MCDACEPNVFPCVYHFLGMSVACTLTISTSGARYEPHTHTDGYRLLLFISKVHSYGLDDCCLLLHLRNVPRMATLKFLRATRQTKVDKVKSLIIRIDSRIYSSSRNGKTLRYFPRLLEAHFGCLFIWKRLAEYTNK